MLFSTSCKDTTGNENDILKVCEEINNNMANYKLVSMDGYPDPEKRKINAYFKDDQPKLLIQEYFGDSGRVITHFYINKDQLIYVLKEDFVYNMPSYLTEDSAKAKGDTSWYDDKKTVLKTSYYFFAKNKLKKWVNENNAVISDSSKLCTEMENQLVGDCLLMLKILKTKED